MEDMAGEEGLGEVEGGLEGDEGADSVVVLEGEEVIVGDGKPDGIIFRERGLIFFRVGKAWRWRHGKNNCVSAGTGLLCLCISSFSFVTDTPSPARGESIP